jgi:ATP-dependent Lon protease
MVHSITTSLGPGHVLALGWTKDRGEVLSVECRFAKIRENSKPQKQVTGNLGPVLHDSIQVAAGAALSFAR